MPSFADPCGIPYYDSKIGDEEAFLAGAMELLGGRELSPEWRDFLIRLYSAAGRGEHAIVEGMLGTLEPADPLRKRAVGLVAAARFPHLAARYLLPRKWYPALMLHVEPNLALPGLRTGRCGFRLPDGGATPEASTVVLGDGYGFDAGLAYDRTLAGRLNALDPSRPVGNLSIPDAGLVQKLIGFELFASSKIETLVVVEGVTGLHAGLTQPVTTFPPIPPLFREEMFHRTFNGIVPSKRKHSEPRAEDEAARAALDIGYDALRTLLRTARRYGVERLMVVAAPHFPAAPTADTPWEAHLQRLAQLSGDRTDLVAFAEETPATATRHSTATAEVCRSEGAVFLDTTAFRAPGGGPTFADLHSLTPAAYDLWATQILARLDRIPKPTTAGEATARTTDT